MWPFLFPSSKLKNITPNVIVTYDLWNKYAQSNRESLRGKTNKVHAEETQLVKEDDISN